MPMDIDLFVHMNNIRYLRATEFSRLFCMFRTGLDKAIRNLSVYVVLTADNEIQKRIETVSKLSFENKHSLLD